MSGNHETKSLVSAKQTVSHAAVLAQHTALTRVGTYVPIELPVVTCHESVTPLDRAWTWWGARSERGLEGGGRPPVGMYPEIIMLELSKLGKHLRNRPTSVGTSPVNMLELRSNLPTIFVNLPICVGMVEENEFPFSLNRCVVVVDEDGDG